MTIATITIRLPASATGDYTLHYRDHQGQRHRLTKIQSGFRPGFIQAETTDGLRMQLAESGKHGLELEGA